jgi:putative aminopeptidase FrvX
VSGSAPAVRGVLAGALLLALAALPERGIPAAPAREGAFEVLRALIETTGVSGHEAPVREAIRRLLPGWAEPKARVDPKGNLLLTVGREGREILFVAHMDETGYEIASIGRDGSARVRGRGGFFHSLYEAQAVRVATGGGEISAVARPRGGYLSGYGSTPALEEGEVVLDFGTGSEAQTRGLGVAEGDPVSIPKRFRRLAGRMGTGRAVDDRAGCTALLLALRRIDPSRLPNRVTFAWVVEEEIGLVGAKALARSLRPETVFAVDTFVSSDSPLENPGFARGVLGDGPVIRALDSSNLSPIPAVDRVRGIAKARGIPIQVGITRGGNDGSVFPVGGAIDVPIAWPTIYSHSPVEVIHEADLENLGRLVAALAEAW